MKEILTSFGGFRTGDDIARAVSRYSLALARMHDTDTIEIPFLAVDGTIQRVEMRIGWLVDIGITEDGSAEVEVVEPRTVRDLHERADAVDQTMVHRAGETAADFSWDFDL